MTRILKNVDAQLNKKAKSCRVVYYLQRMKRICTKSDILRLPSINCHWFHSFFHICHVMETDCAICKLANAFHLHKESNQPCRPQCRDQKFIHAALDGSKDHCQVNALSRRPLTSGKSINEWLKKKCDRRRLTALLLPSIGDDRVNIELRHDEKAGGSDLAQLSANWVLMRYIYTRAPQTRPSAIFHFTRVMNVSSAIWADLSHTCRGNIILSLNLDQHYLADL